MDPRLESDIARPFRELAAAYCALIDRRNAVPRGTLVTQLRQTLALLYCAGLRLTDADLEDAAPDVENALSEEEEQVLRNDLALLFDDHTAFLEFFERRAGAETLLETPPAGFLATDLTLIYQEARTSAKVERDCPQFPGYVLWRWYNDFNEHWAQPLTRTLNTLQALIGNGYDSSLSDVFTMLRERAAITSDPEYDPDDPANQAAGEAAFERSLDLFVKALLKDQPPEKA